VLEANRSIGAERNIDPFGDPRINLVVNDARNALRLTSKRYDAIVSQPSHPWTAGASHLYTREFMKLARSRLRPDGVFLQWMNTQFVSEPLLRSLVATLLDVFPHVRAYQFDSNVLFFLASESEIEPEVQIVATGEPFLSNAAEFRRKGIGSVNDLVAALAWDTDGSRRLAAGAPLITDNDNRMAMRSVATFQDDALPYARLQELIAQYGPVFDQASDLYQALGPEIDFLYVLDRLEFVYAHDLSRSLADTLLSNRNTVSLLLGAKILQAQNQGPQADQLLLAALELEPGDPVVTYLLLRGRADAIVDGTLPESLRAHVENLTEVSRAVIECKEFVRRRDLECARSRDEVIAGARPDDQWYLDAAKLRADWRITASRLGESTDHAAAALAIIDEAIALRQDLDFYGMRMAAAYLADDFHAVVETARRMVWMMREAFDLRSDGIGRPFSKREIERLEFRLESMQQGLMLVRQSGRIADYKFAALEQNIVDLRQKIASYVLP
jgi:hypothetical protein